MAPILISFNYLASASILHRLGPYFNFTLLQGWFNRYMYFCAHQLIVDWVPSPFYLPHCIIVSSYTSRFIFILLSASVDPPHLNMLIFHSLVNWNIPYLLDLLLKTILVFYPYKAINFVLDIFIQRSAVVLMIRRITFQEKSLCDWNYGYCCSMFPRHFLSHFYPTFSNSSTHFLLRRPVWPS